MTLFKVLASTAALLGVLAAPVASAAAITDGFTYSVADAYIGPSGVGTHFHSNTGGAFGNPAGLAEVGRLGSEEVRGLSEYNLGSLGNAASAFVTFDVFQLGGLFGQANYAGPISIYAYTGNNTEDLSDFQAAAVGLVGSFSSAGLLASDVLSFDITSIFNAAIDDNIGSLGIRLQMNPLLAANQAIVFHDFRLTTDDQSTVPEPGSLLLTALALLALFGLRRQRC